MTRTLDRRGCALGVIVAAVVLAAPAAARAAEVDGPSIFRYGFDGILLGGGAGVAGGYLAARAGGWQTDDWKPLAYGAGIGALAGGALGLSLGVADTVNATSGRGSVILRDGSLGMGFGGVAGAIVGGLGAIGSRRAEHILLGGAIGALAGTGVGLVLGVVEAQGARRPPRVALTVAPAVGAAGLVWMPAVAGRF
jgi:hypothetical protein